MQTNRWAGLVLASLVALAPLLAAQAPQSPAKPASAVNKDARILLDFKTRIDQYLDVRKKAQKGGPALKESNDAAAIKVAEDRFAMLIRDARSSAKPGDIFTPEIRAKFRRLLVPELKGEDGRDARAVLKDDAPTGVALKVNMDYPESKTLPTVPAAILTSLPTLPKEIEYRFIERHLILRDAEANIIVDFIPNALPRKP